MSANGLADFLESQKIPSLAECFQERRIYVKFLASSDQKDEVGCLLKGLLFVFIVFLD